MIISINDIFFIDACEFLVHRGLIINAWTDLDCAGLHDIHSFKFLYYCYPLYF